MTAKTLTKDMIEGTAPMCFIIERFSQEGFDGMLMLLYRCLKIYRIKEEATKILLILIMLNYSTSKLSNDSTLKLWKRVK
jgi:hypothetical protein